LLYFGFSLSGGAHRPHITPRIQNQAERIPAEILRKNVEIRSQGSIKELSDGKKTKPWLSVCFHLPVVIEIQWCDVWGFHGDEDSSCGPLCHVVR